MRPLGALLGVLFLQGAVAAAYESGAVADGAVVRGTVRLSGTVPAAAPHEVFKHREVCGATVANESLVLGPGQSLRYAVVSLEGVSRGKEVERDAVNVVDNRECRFVPHVVAASVGQWLLLTNGDPILHNADGRDLESRRTLFNVALPPGKQVRRPLTTAGTMRITCEVRHTWMEAFVVVADHPYVTVTDAEGTWELRDVPPGSYRLRVWHERLGVRERPITVEKGGLHVEDLAYAAKE